MRSILLMACLVLPACTASEDTNWALTAHITSTQPFDQMSISQNDGSPSTVTLNAATMAHDYHTDEFLDEVTSLSVTVMLDGNAIATAAATNIAYTQVNDYDNVADITLPVNP